MQCSFKHSNMKSTVFVITIVMVFTDSAFADPVGTCSHIMDPEEVQFLVDSDDCSVFYKCNWGKPEMFQCLNGLHINKETGNCDWPELAGCNENDNNGNLSNENNTEEELSSNEIDSNEIVPSEKKCPDDQCPAENGEFADLFPHPEDCEKFCKCDRGIAYDKLCPAGLHFNNELKTCDWPENANCNNDDSIDNGSGEPDSPEIDDGSGDVDQSKESEEKPGSNEGVCPDNQCPELNSEFPVFFAHPEECEKYCVCDWGKAYDMKCPSGLHFSLDLNVCVEPEMARCE